MLLLTNHCTLSCIIMHGSQRRQWLSNIGGRVGLKPRLHDTTCCQAGCIMYTNIQLVVKHNWFDIRVWQPVVSCIQPVVKPVVRELEFNVPFQHKHGYIRDDKLVVQPGLITGWSNSGCLFNPVERTAAVPSTRLSNRFDNWLWRGITGNMWLTLIAH